jgi:hypothetical protein
MAWASVFGIGRVCDYRGMIPAETIAGLKARGASEDRRFVRCLTICFPAIHGWMRHVGKIRILAELTFAFAASSDCAAIFALVFRSFRA